MTAKSPTLRLLLTGIWPRLAIAALILCALWLGFFWAITPPGAR